MQVLAACDAQEALKEVHNLLGQRSQSIVFKGCISHDIYQESLSAPDASAQISGPLLLLHRDKS